MAKSKLKDEIEAIKKEHAAEVRRVNADKVAADKKKEQEELRAAKLIVAAIPARVREQIGVFGSIPLCSGDKNGVGRDKGSCTGLAAKIIALLEDEGLGDSVYVDLDCSGSWHTDDELKFRI